MWERWILCASMLAGCDVIWSIDHVGPVDGGSSSGDGLPDVALIDAPTGPCMAGEHDEDGDSTPDRCDICPGHAGSQSADADGDGVGDACDPDPSTDQSVALFISFNEPSQYWMPLAGTWDPDTESLTYASHMDNTHGIVRYMGALPPPPYVVEAHFQVQAIPTAQVATLYMLLDTDDAIEGDAGVACSLDRAAVGADRTRAHDANPLTTAFGNMTNMVSPGGYRMIATYQPSGAGPRVSCSLRADDSSTTGSASQPLMPPSDPGKFGFRIYKIRVTLHWIAFYTND